MPKKNPQKYTHLYDFVQRISGETGLKVFQIIGDGVTDDVIEKKAGIKIAEVRSVLNHLHSFGVVDYTREKNLNTGWYTYTWKVLEERALQNYLQMLKREKTALQQKLQTVDDTVTYYSKKTNRIFSFEEAFENQFKCPESSTVLKEVDKKQQKKQMTQRLQEVENLLSAYENKILA